MNLNCKTGKKNPNNWNKEFVAEFNSKLVHSWRNNFKIGH